MRQYINFFGLLFLSSLFLSSMFASELQVVNNFLQYDDVYWDRIAFEEKYKDDLVLNYIQPIYQEIKNFFCLYLPEKFPNRGNELVSVLLLRDILVEQRKELIFSTDDIIAFVKIFAFLAENEKKFTNQTNQLLYLNAQKILQTKQKKGKRGSKSKPEYTDKPLYDLKQPNRGFKIIFENKTYEKQIDTQERSLREALEKSGFSIQDIPFFVEHFLLYLIVDLDIANFSLPQNLSLFSLTIFFKSIFSKFVEKFLPTSRQSDNDLRASCLVLLKSLIDKIAIKKLKNNILISYVQKAFSFFGVHPEINQENLESLRVIFVNEKWIEEETEEQKLSRLVKIEEKRQALEAQAKKEQQSKEKKRRWKKKVGDLVENKKEYVFDEPQLLFDVPIKKKTSDEFIVKKELSDYLQEYPEKPKISIGTEHLTKEEFENIFGKKVGIWALSAIDHHKMPGDIVTHQGEYVVNLDEDRNPDLQGDIRNTSLQKYLLKQGKQQIYLIWEEYLDDNVMADSKHRKVMLDFVYNLLRDKGFFVFKTFSDSVVPTIKQMYEPFLKSIGEKFGKKNVVRYDFDHDAFLARRVLIKAQSVTLLSGERFVWNYSDVSFPLSLEVPIVQLREHETVEDLPNYVKNLLGKGTYQFNDQTKQVYEKIIIESRERLQNFDKREKTIAEIDPILAKYQTSIIVAQKTVEKAQKPPEIHPSIQIPIISKQIPSISAEKLQKFDQPIQMTISEKPKKVPHWWDKMKQYITVSNMLQIGTALSLPVIFYLIYKKYHKK